MRRYSLGGTRPWNTSASVPRLIPLYKARTTTAPAGAVRVSVRISPRPGATTQNARASADIGRFCGFLHHDTIPARACCERSPATTAGPIALDGGGGTHRRRLPRVRRSYRSVARRVLSSQGGWLV